MVWNAFMSAESKEFATFAITILKIMVNQAACERLFSCLKKTDKRNRIGLKKVEKMSKVF
jgi:hypothetical protein